MWLSPSLKRGNGLVAAYRESLIRYSPLYLVLELFVIAALGYYRIRAGTLLGGISPDLLSGEGHGSYLAAALSTDTLAAALIVTVLAGAWLLTPILKTAAALLSLIVVFAYSSFMVFAADFLRIYQTAFGRGYIGSEHFTGINSMLISAGAELSSVSRIALIVLTAMLVSSSIIALLKGKNIGFRAVFLAKKISSLAATLALAACVLSSSLAKSGVAEKLPSSARIQGLEVGRNPLSAFLFGPRHETFTPPASDKGIPAYYNTDSIEKAGASRPLPAVAKGRYNVVLYFCESTSWQYYDLEYHGRPVLPVMHSLARNGLLLKNHYATYPLSAQTLYSVLSSRYPVYGKSSIFREYHDVDVHTLPEVLSENGYATCFIHTGDLLYASRNRFLANRNIGTFILYKDLVKDGKYRKKVGWGADERSMIRPAADWIKAQSSPFLLMMAPVNPHHPYAIPEDVEKIADPGEAGIGEGEKHWRNYLNSLHYADAAMGQLVETLEREGLMRNTVFVMVTDHGEAFYQHPRNYNHPLFIYEENVHVPALFYSKSLFPVGIELESVTRHVDIMPSILDLIGIGDATRRDGESIFSLSKEKMAVFHTSWNDEFMGVRDGKWKYIQRMKDSSEELYDLEADPGEKANIAEANPLVVSRYRKVSDDMVSYMREQYRNIARKH
jgi:arylsulfatase A-like enzyme